MEVDWDSDEDTVHDIIQLNAVLEAENALPSEHVSVCSTPGSTSLSSATTQTRRRYAKIHQALSANNLVDERLRRLENILVGRLRQCRNKLKELVAAPVTLEKQDRTFKYVNCGKPYFRDKDNFPPPENEDTILMAKSNMYDFSRVIAVPGWTVKDKSECLSVIHSMSIDVKKKELNSKLAQLNRDYKKLVNKKEKMKYEIKIEAVKKEIETVKKKSLNELALPLDQEYDWDLLANKMSLRHSPSEFRALWKLFLHPSINKSTWSKTEYMNLQKIAYDHNLQDWEEIAHKLNTGRTAYQCFVYFRTNLSNTFTGVKWTREEEEYLKRLIEYYKEDNYIPWSRVASYMENRTKIQIYNKYARLTEQRKGRFLPEEDAVILTCYNKFGKNFKVMAKYLPGRSIMQLRTRFNVLTSKTRTSSVWTIEEDRRLIQCMAQEETVKNYANLTKHFPGKDRANIRTRYVTLMKWLKRHPQEDVAQAPRRGARSLGHGRATQDLNKALEELNKRMECVVEKHKNIPKITRNSPEEEIEDAIVATLIDEEINKEKEWKNSLINYDGAIAIATPEELEPKVDVSNLQKVLLLLRSKLDKVKFDNSLLNMKYPDIDKADKCHWLLYNTYSKKSKVSVVQIRDAPDIWGNKLLEQSGFVLPPNYGTLTGCRKLMSYVSQKCVETSTMNLTVLMKRNVLVREQVELLIARFTTLFLWPMLLSNENPKELRKENPPVVVKRKRPIMDNTDIPSSGITIPTNLKRSTSESDTDKIDLDDSMEDDNTVINEGDVYKDGFLEFEFGNL